MFDWFKNLFKKQASPKMTGARLPGKGTRMVETESGLKVECPNDRSDGYADAVARCFNTGETVQGTIDKDGKIHYEEIKDE